MAIEDVAVVGAGPAGLAAAWRLASAGAEVTLYERAHVTGGRMRTDEWSGARVDPLVQLLASYFSRTFRLAAEVGATSLLVPARGRDALWRGGRAHPITYGSVASLTASSALPVRLKMRLATRYLPFLMRHARQLDPADPAGSGAAELDGESIAEWGRRELSEDFVELLAYPLLAAYYSSVPEETGAGYYHALAGAGMNVEVYAVRGGVGALSAAVTEALVATGAVVRTGHEVVGVELTPDGVQVAWQGGAETHGSVVLAIPAGQAARLVPGSPAVRIWLEGLVTRPGLVVALLLSRPADVDFFGLSVPRSEAPGSRVAAVCFQEQKLDGLVPSGRGLLVVCPAPAAMGELVDARSEVVVDHLLPAMDHLVPGTTETVERAKVYRDSDGGTVFRPGHLARISAFRELELPRGVALAGDYLVAPTVEGAVRSGSRAAERLLAARGQ